MLRYSHFFRSLKTKNKMKKKIEIGRKFNMLRSVYYFYTYKKKRINQNGFLFFFMSVVLCSRMFTRHIIFWLMLSYFFFLLIQLITLILLRLYLIKYILHLFTKLHTIKLIYSNYLSIVSFFFAQHNNNNIFN